VAKESRLLVIKGDAAQAMQADTPQGPVKKIKEIQAEVESVTGIALEDKVLVQGILREQVFFVDASDIVRHQEFRFPFSQLVEIPGTRPGMTVQVQAVLEDEIFHFSKDGTALIQKVILLLTVTVTDLGEMAVAVEGGTTTITVERVVGQKTVQVLVVKQKVFKQVIVEVIIVGGIVEIKEQVLLVLTKSLEAIKIKNIASEVRDVTTRLIEPDTLIVSGVVHKQIFFVSPDNIVRLQEEDVPFSQTLKVPGIAPGVPVEVDVTVEFVVAELDTVRGILKQKVVLVITARVGTEPRPVQVVADVVAPGVVVTKVKIRVDTRILEVVTDVSGPGVIRVDKTVIFAVVVNVSPFPVPLEVVTNVVLDP